MRVLVNDVAGKLYVHSLTFCKLELLLFTYLSGSLECFNALVPFSSERASKHSSTY